MLSRDLGVYLQRVHDAGVLVRRVLVDAEERAGTLADGARGAPHGVCVGSLDTLD